MKKLIVIFLFVLISCSTYNIIPLNPVVYIRELSVGALALADTGASMTIINCSDVVVKDDIVEFKFKDVSYTLKLDGIGVFMGLNSTENIPMVIVNLGYKGRYKEIKVALQNMPGWETNVLLGRNWFGGKYLVNTKESKR